MFSTAFASTQRSLVVLGFLAIWLIPMRAATVPVMVFDIPAGAAETSLLRFAEQAHVQFLLSSEKIKGIRTNELKGTFTPREAIGRMLDGTGLVIVFDDDTGAFTVRSASHTAETNSKPSSILHETSPYPRTPAGSRNPNDTVVLTPFTVTTTQDRGYKATNATTGTRMDMSIKDIPLNLEVITNKFIRDTGATNLREALRYSAGLVLESQADAFYDADFDSQGSGANDPRGVTRRAGDSTTKLRGFVIEQMLRDGFRRDHAVDAITIERIELLRGPSGLLYGIGSFGGVINYMPKRPNREPASSVGFTLGSNNLERAEFDVNQPGPGGALSPDVRIMGAVQRTGDFTEFHTRRSITLSPVFLFRPAPGSTVIIDTEFGNQNETGLGFQNIRAGLNGTAYRTDSWLTDASDHAVNNRTFRWSGVDTYLKGPFRNIFVDLQQRFGEHAFLRIGAGNTNTVFNSRQIRSTEIVTSAFSLSDPSSYDPAAMVVLDGQSIYLTQALARANESGSFLGRSPAQIAYARPKGSFRGDQLYGHVSNNSVLNSIIPGPPVSTDIGTIRYRWFDNNQVTDSDQVRIDFNYRLDLGPWGKHSLVAGLQYAHSNASEDEYGPPESTKEQPLRDAEIYSYKNPQDYSYFHYGVQGDGFPDAKPVHLRHTKRCNWDQGLFFVYQGQFFKDRLTLIGGIRHDRDDAREITAYPNDPSKAPWIGGRAPNTTVPTATSPQAGASFALSKEVSLFGVYSTGVVPQYTALDGNGKLFEPTKARNTEAGLKFDLLEGKISGTVSAFRIRRNNTPHFLWWAPAPYKNAQNGYDPAQPSTTVWQDFSPGTLWYAIKFGGGLDVAKRILPSGFYPMLERVASIPPKSNDPELAEPAALDAVLGGKDQPLWWGFDRDPVSGQRLGLAREASENTNAGNFGTGLYYPLVNLSDSEVARFISAAKSESPTLGDRNNGYGGNFYYTNGRSYRFGDGGSGFGNAPDGAGASVGMNDESSGWDMSVVISARDDLQFTVNYSHVNRKITSNTYSFVKAPYWPVAWWYARDAYFGTLDYGRKPKDAYGDVKDTSTYHAPIPDYGQSADDTPENMASLWMRASLDQILSPVKGFTFGVGGKWEDKRLWFTGFTGGGGNVAYVTDANGNRILVTLKTRERYELNAYLEYRTVFSKRYKARLALNADNILDDQGRYGLVYASGFNYRLSAGLEF